MGSGVIEAGEVSFAALHAGVDELLAVDLTSAADDGLLDALRDLQTLTNRLATVEHALIAEVDSRGMFQRHMCANTAVLLAGVLRLTRHEAKVRVAAAEAAGPRRGLTGEALGPVFGHVAEAQGEGAISPAHARLVVRTVDKLPYAATAKDGDAIEQTLVDAARTLDTRELGLVCERMELTVDPDGKLTDENYRQRMRDLRVNRRSDGSSTLTGDLTAEATEKFLTVLDTLARPRPEADGAKDPRTPGQRNHDALIDLSDRLLRSGTLPESGGVTATVVITMSDEAWRTGRGIATTGHGAVLPARQGIELAGGDARILAVAMGSMREVTGYGYLHRFFTETQRCVFAARDGGCSFPGCDTPPAWCQSDHIIEVKDGGKTTVANGHLLCGHHHRQKNLHGWRVEIEGGRPAWIPPPWIDPETSRESERDPSADTDPARQPMIHADVGEWGGISRVCHASVLARSCVQLGCVPVVPTSVAAKAGRP